MANHLVRALICGEDGKTLHKVESTAPHASCYVPGLTARGMRKVLDCYGLKDERAAFLRARLVGTALGQDTSKWTLKRLPIDGEAA